MRVLAPLLFAVTLLAASIVAGCLGSAPVKDHGQVPTQDAIGSAPVASFLHNVSQKIPGVNVLNSILLHARIPMVDNLNLDAWVVRPKTEEKVPLVLEATPYYGGGSPLTNQCPALVPTSGHCFGTWGEELVSRGYAVGILSVRGTGDSEGCFTQAGPQEAKDTAAAVEYFAAQSWSNGHVGLMGVSYPGTTPMDVWVEAPPHLSTVIPIEGITDLYKYSFVNGIPIIYGFNNYYWAIVGLGPAGLEGGSQAYDPADAVLAIKGEACPEQVDVQRAGVMGIANGNKDSYWQQRDFTAELRKDWTKKRAPIFYIEGFQDWNVKPHNADGWIQAVQETGVPFKSWLGQWDHNWPDGSFSGGASHCDGKKSAACRYDWWNSTMIAWFDQWLKGVDTGIMDAPPIQVESDNKLWRSEAHFPPLDQVWARRYLSADGKITNQPGAGTVHFNDQRGRQPENPALVTQPDRAVWVSDAFETDQYLSGMPHFEGNATATGQRASLIFTLYKRIDGKDTAINFGGYSLNHAKDLANADPNIAGKKIHVSFNFFPQDNFIPKGAKLVLVATGYPIDGHPSFEPISDGSDITMDLEGAHFDLPVDPSIVLEDPQPFVAPS